jgi:hypothetical protein
LSSFLLIKPLSQVILFVLGWLLSAVAAAVVVVVVVVAAVAVELQSVQLPVVRGVVVEVGAELEAGVV